MARKFTPKRIRNVRSSKVTRVRPDSVAGKGVNITGLDNLAEVKRRENALADDIRMSSAVGSGALSGADPFFIGDTVQSKVDYQRPGSVFVPNESGNETTYVELLSDEMTRAPRKWRNLINTTLAKNPANWTQTNAAITYSKGSDTFTVTGLEGGNSDQVYFTTENLGSVADRELFAVCRIKASTAGDIGKNVSLRLIRETGTAYSVEQVVTLTGEWQTISTPLFTGLSDNVDVLWQIRGAASNIASGCVFQSPNIQEVTNLTNKTPSEPVWGDDSPTELVTNGQFAVDGDIPYAKFDGAGSLFELAKSEGNTITSSFAVAAYVNVADWTKTGGMGFISDWNGTGDLAFITEVDATGRMSSYADDTGTGGVSQSTSSVSIEGTVPTDTWVWLLFDIDMPNSHANFYFNASADRNADPKQISWSRIGDADRAFGGTNPTSISASTVDLELGAYNGGASAPFADKMSIVYLYNGELASGEVAASWDAANFIGEYLLSADHNMFPVAARHDIEGQWTQVGTGTVSEVSGKQRLVTDPGFDVAGSATSMSETISGDWVFDDGGTTGGSAAFSGGQLTLTQGSNSVWLGAVQEIDVSGCDWVACRSRIISASSGSYTNVRFGLNSVATLIGGTPDIAYQPFSQANETLTLLADVRGYDTVYAFVNDGQIATATSVVEFADFKPFALDGTGHRTGPELIPNATGPLKQPYPTIEPELTQDGSFNSGIDEWDNLTIFGDATISWNGSALEIDANSSGVNSYARISNIFTVGKTYVISGTAEVVSGTGSVLLSANGANLLNRTGAGTVTDTVVYKATDNWLQFQVGAANGTIGTLDNISIKEADPTYWYEKDGINSVTLQGLSLDRNGGGPYQLQRPLDLSNYQAGDVLHLQLSTETQSHSVNLFFTESDGSTEQASFRNQYGGMRSWFHVLTQEDIDNTAFLTLGTTFSTAATATGVRVSMKKWQGSFTVLDDQDAAAGTNWYYNITTPTNNQDYVATYKVSEGTAADTLFRVALNGGTGKNVEYKLDWSARTLTLAGGGTPPAVVSTSVSFDVNGVATVTLSFTDNGANNDMAVYVYAASDGVPADTGNVIVHSVTLTGANWTPNGNISINQTDWVPGSDCVAGAYGGSLFLINTDASASNAAQQYATEPGRSYVASITGVDADTRLGISTNTAGSADLLDLIGTSEAGEFTDSSAGSYISLLSNSSTLGLSREFTSVSLQESSYGLGTSRYKNNNVVFGGVVYDEELWWAEFNAVTGASATIPHDDVTRVTQDFSIRARLSDLTLGANMTIAAQAGSATETAWGFDIGDSGKVTVNVSDDGTPAGQSNALGVNLLPSVVDVTGLFWLRADRYFLNGQDYADYYVSTDFVADSDDVTTWTVLEEGVAGALGDFAHTIFDSASDVEIGSTYTRTLQPFNGNIHKVEIYEGTTRLTNWSAENAVELGPIYGAAQIKTNAQIPLHQYVDVDIDDHKTIQEPAAYEHFATSTAMSVGDDTISSLANATHPNGSQGIKNQVTALPNLLPARSRALFANIDATITGVGYCTDIVGTETVMYESDFSAGVDNWGQYISDPNLQVTGNETAPDGTTECLKLFANGGNKGFQIAHQSGAVTEIPGRVYKLEYDIYAPAGSLTDANCILQVGYGSAPATQLTPQYGVNYQYDQWVSCTSLTVNLGLTASILRMVGTVGLATYTSGGIAANNAVYLKNIRISTMDIYSDVEYSVFDDQQTDLYRAYFEKLSTLNGSKIMQAEFILGKGTAPITDVVVAATSFTGADIWRIDWSNPSATPTFYGAYSATEDTDITWELVGQDSEGNDKYKLTITTKTEASGTYFETYVYGAGFDNNEVGTVKIYADMAHRQISATAEPEWNTLRPGDSVTQYLLQQHDFQTTWGVYGPVGYTTGQPDPRGGTNATTLDDQNAGSYAGPTQTISPAANAGDIVWLTCWFPKLASQSLYPRLDLDGATTSRILIDQVNGRIIDQVATTTDYSFIIDGAVIKSLLPDAFPDGDNFWFVGIGDIYVSGTYAVNLIPAASTVFDGSVSNTLTGENTYFEPAVTVGGPFFFDSIATTATVTEEIQDWSKIFTFLAEGSNNVVNAVFSHQYHTLLGHVNSTAGSQEVTGGSATYVNTADATWGIQNTATETDVVSIFPGEVANKVTGDGTPMAITGLFGTFDTTYADYLFAIVETTSTTDDVAMLLRDDTAGTNLYRPAWNFSNFTATQGINISTIFGPKFIPLGKGPNGGDLWGLLAAYQSPTNGNARRLYAYPNDDASNTGHASIWHYYGCVNSAGGTASILPIPDGSRYAHTKWEYPLQEAHNDLEGTLLTDFILTLSASDMDVTPSPGSIDILGDANTLLHIESSERLRTRDGTTSKYLDSVESLPAVDLCRSVVAWSNSANEHTQALRYDGYADDDSTSITYDGSMNLSDSLKVLRPGGTEYELFISRLVGTKAYSDAAQRSSLTEYDE